MRARLVMLDDTVEETEVLTPQDYWTIQNAKWPEGRRTFILETIDTGRSGPTAIYRQAPAA